MRAGCLIAFSAFLTACAARDAAPPQKSRPAASVTRPQEVPAPPRAHAPMSMGVEPRLCDDFHVDAAVVSAAQARCDGGDGAGCMALARPYWCGQGVPLDRNHAVLVASRACDLGDADACGVAGTLEMLRGPERDGARARRLLGKSCDRGVDASCENLALLDLADGTSADAVPVLERLCAKGHDIACANIAQLLAIGDRMKRDPARARKLGLAACEHDLAVGCNAVGLVAAGATPPDTALSAQMFTKACELGSLAACGNLGIAYLNGIGVRVDAAEAERLFQKACDGGEAHSCTELARMRAKPRP